MLDGQRQSDVPARATTPQPQPQPQPQLTAVSPTAHTQPVAALPTTPSARVPVSAPTATTATATATTATTASPPATVVAAAAAAAVAPATPLKTPTAKPQGTPGKISVIMDYFQSDPVRDLYNLVGPSL